MGLCKSLIDGTKTLTEIKEKLFRTSTEATF